MDADHREALRLLLEALPQVRRTMTGTLAAQRVERAVALLQRAERADREAAE